MSVPDAAVASDKRLGEKNMSVGVSGHRLFSHKWPRSESDRARGDHTSYEFIVLRWQSESPEERRFMDTSAAVISSSSDYRLGVER